MEGTKRQRYALTIRITGFKFNNLLFSAFQHGVRDAAINRNCHRPPTSRAGKRPRLPTWRASCAEAARFLHVWFLVRAKVKPRCAPEIWHLGFAQGPLPIRVRRARKASFLEEP